MSDHARGCEGREYTCTCGYDDERDALIERLAKALEKFETARHELSYMRADDVPLSDTVAGEILTCGHLREVCAAYREVRAVLAAKASKP